MIFKHNLNELSRFHPGGSKNFSPEDRALTQRMVDIFHPLQIKILDHIIVAGTGYSSMAEKGIVPYQSKSTADYEKITLGSISVGEKRNRFQNTYSR
jgi:DNA repair protein RadC